MIAPILSTLVAASLPTAEPAIAYRDASIDVGGRLLDARFVEIDRGTPPTLVLAVRPDRSEGRELRLHPLDRNGVPVPTPARTIPVLDDVTAYGFADVREEPGREVLFFTRGGVFALSTKRDGLRDNIARLVRHDLVFDVPDPDELAFWEYVIERDEPATDLLVVPGRFSFSVWAPAGREDGAYREAAGFADVVHAGSPDESTSVVVQQRAEVNVVGTSISVGRNDTDASRLMLDSAPLSRHSLLAFDRSYDAPTLGDVDGDGRTDLVVSRFLDLRVHIADEHGIPAEPTRVEAYPEYLGKRPPGELIDVDGDGDDDLVSLLSVEGEGSGFVSEVYTLLVMLNDGERLLPDRPDQLMRFEAMEMRIEIADVDGDGVLDLVVRKFEVPSAVDVVTSLDFTHTTLLFLGTGGREGRVFGRRPVLKSEQVYDESSVQNAIASRNFTRDFSGDGMADMVEIDALGAVSIRRLEHASSFFGGDSWELDREAWRRLEGRGSIASLVVDDFNGDGLGDVLSRRSTGVLLLVSDRTGGAR